MNIRSIVIYGLIGLALLVFIVLGVSWAKNRSQQYAAQPQDQTSQDSGDQNQGGQVTPPQDQQNPSSDGGQNQAAPTDSSDQNQGDGHIGGAATTGPTQVPAAGTSDWVMLLGATMLAVYALARFAQSRKLLSSR